MKPTEEQIATAREKGDVFSYEAGKFTFLVRRPMTLPYQAALNATQELKAQALDKLARSVVAFPAIEEYEKIAATYVGIPTLIAGFAMKLAMCEEEAEAKKA